MRNPGLALKSVRDDPKMGLAVALVRLPRNSMQPAPDRQTEPLFIPRPARRERPEVTLFVARLRGTVPEVRCERLNAVRERLSAGELDTPEVFRAVARRLLGE